MAIVSSKRDPLARDFMTLQEEINRLFDFDPLSKSFGLFDRASATSPPMDVVENVDSFNVFCELPGVEMDDLELTVAGDAMTIKGRKLASEIPDGAKVYKRESWHGDFQRTLSMPQSVDLDNVEASMTDGVLKIVLPKREELKPRKITLVARE